MSRCVWDTPWYGQCREPAGGKDGLFCREHRKKTCTVCGQQATRDCGHMTAFMCGMPLCGSRSCEQIHWYKAHSRYDH